MNNSITNYYDNAAKYLQQYQIYCITAKAAYVLMIIRKYSLDLQSILSQCTDIGFP